MTDPFETLGVPRRFRLDIKQLEQRHRDLSRALHPDKFTQASPAERKLSLEKSIAVNGAFRALKNPQTRAAALLELAGRKLEEHARAPAALLASVMELREQLDALCGLQHSSEKQLQIEALRASVQALVDEQEHTIATVFDTESPPTEAQLEQAYQAVLALRYYYRFLEEADGALSEA